MDFAQLLPWAIFFGITCAAWAALGHFSVRPGRVEERLESLRNLGASGESELPEEAHDVGAILERAAPTLSRPLKPATRLEQQNLKLRLARAGFNSPHAGDIYLSIRFTGLIVGWILGSGFGFVAFGLSINGLFSMALCAATGFYAPEYLLHWISKTRQDRIFLALPAAIDLLIICIEVGQGLDVALRRVAKELALAAPDLCAEFNLYCLQLQMGRVRREALHDLGVRAGVDDLNAMSAVLMQADRFGISIAQSLREQADSLRVKRRQRAEERAQKTAVKLIFPLVLFIFPGIFVVLVGPAAISMINDMLHI